jgi:hypothetical protein
MPQKPMLLMLFDSGERDALFAALPIESDYDAEGYVLMSRIDPRNVGVVRWVLFDANGVRCVWQRPSGSYAHPTITYRSCRYTKHLEERRPDEVMIS